ncbi:hypothetical protein HPB51_023077 [Rhipicephalus microplus]|uniref:Uncharacterized protein n=1 Tax=Rhipicephalus microplus TaxID=6941 RepID=A0A9J6EDB4_RHIMP|nr:hypothetical protein HPB51_023077 [Rhipicephalus microplus]
MRGLLVLMVVLEASAQSSQQHARHWRNYLNGLLAQLAQEEPHRDLRHELWKDMFSHRVRSFLNDDDYDDDDDDPNPGDDGVVNLGGRGMPNDDRLTEAWRNHIGHVLLARPAFVKRRRASTSYSSAEVFSPYNRRTTRRTTKQLISTSSSDSPHMHRFLDIINAHGARHLREPAPPLQCRCSDREKEAGNGSSLLAQLVTSSVTREPPLLLVVPGLMVAPRGGPFAIVRGVEGPANASDARPSPIAVIGGVSSPTPTWPPMPTGKLHRHRLRFVLLLVAFLLVLSSLMAYYVRSFLSKYRREYEIIRNAQFL